MWSIISKILGRSEPKPEPSSIADPERVSRMLEAIDAGVAGRALPTLVCRTCGLKYENTGTYLRGAQCPDCAAKTG